MEEKIKFGWKSLLTIFFQVALSSQETLFFTCFQQQKLRYNDGVCEQKYCKNIVLHWQLRSHGRVCEQKYCKNIW